MQSIRIRAGLTVYLVLTSLTPIFAASAKGFIPSQCPMTGESHIHLTSIDGHKLSREVLLRMPEQRLWQVGDEWYEYPGEQCSSGKCEPAISSEVQIRRLSWSSAVPFRSRRITSVVGTFKIELKNGKTRTGSFEAKLIRLPKGATCE